MRASPRVLNRLSDLVRARNRELASDALLKAALGVVFSLFTFGVMFWFGWVLGFFFGRSLGLQPWQFGAIVMSVFLILSTWSAWRRVDPLADLEPLTDRQAAHLLVGRAAGLGAFSPRHATAGAALVLLGGPGALFEALGVWAHRLPNDPSLIDQAAQMLEACKQPIPIEEIRLVPAALLLRRLALIKAVPSGESHAVVLTEKGMRALAGTAKANSKGEEHGESF